MRSEKQISEAEIKRERMHWAQRQRDKHRRFFRRLQHFSDFSFHTSNTFMDYLHGDVPKEEAESAIAYECARESRAVWRAARRRDKLFKNGWRGPDGSLHLLEYKKAALMALRSAPGGLYPMWAVRFLFLKSFPKNDWFTLNAEQRQEFGRPQVPPLPMTGVVMLNDMGVFDQFKEIAKANHPVVEDVPPGKRGQPMRDVRPILQCGNSSLYHALFNVDFSITKSQLVKEFKAWLDLPENQNRLKEWQKPKVDPISNALARLKNLAAWRLFRELANDCPRANDFANNHRKWLNPKEPRPFRDAKPQDGGRIPSNQADLFGEVADAYEAQTSAWAYLAEVMPQEFAPLSDGMAEVFVQLEKVAQKTETRPLL